MTPSEYIYLQIAQRIAAAESLYGSFSSAHEAIGVALEEWHELIGAVHRNSAVSIRDECIDLAAVLIRMAGAVDEHAFRVRSNLV